MGLVNCKDVNWDGWQINQNQLTSPPLSQPFIYLYNFITNLVLSTYLLLVEDRYVNQS